MVLFAVGNGRDDHMPTEHVLLEFQATDSDAFEMHASGIASESEGQHQAEKLVHNLSGIGLELDEDSAPVPLFGSGKESAALGLSMESFASGELSPDLPSTSKIVSCTIDAAQREKVAAREDLRVWPNSALTLLDSDTLPEPSEQEALIDGAWSTGRVDCRPFRPGATIGAIRHLLGVDAIWREGFRGQNIIVGILDEGVDGSTYPVIGGFSRANAGQQPGTAPVTSHGSMCAADVLIAAPMARLYDYPFLGVPRSGGALQMFHAVLDQRRKDGTPHLTNNSYGFVGVPDPNRAPNHEVHDRNHPLHRKVAEVVQSGAPAFFAAGNCGSDCPSGACHGSGIGAGRSIHASNSLEDVITVAAVNSRHERIGYSSQGPGMFDREKPDVAAYSHIFANFGPGRPGGMQQPFDNGTSAATPVATGVAALILSAIPGVSPSDLKAAIIQTAIQTGPTVGWSPDFGYGVINAAGLYSLLR